MEAEGQSASLVLGLNAGQKRNGGPAFRTRVPRASGFGHLPLQADSDPRRWGMKLAEHGGKRGKKRAVIAVAVSSAQLGSLRLRDRARRII